MLRALQALANGHRLRIVSALHRNGRTYVSQLARDVGISRPLLHLHLQKLEAAGLVVSHLELSPEGKALNFYQTTEFAVTLSAATVAEAADSLSHEPNTTS